MSDNNQTMIALTLNQAGEDFQLEKQSVPLPELGNRQVLIKVEYAGLNPVDSKLAKSGHSAWQYPHIPALDGVGIVVKSQSELCPLVGKRVLWHSDLTAQGALAEYVAIDAYAVSVVPDEVDPVVAATLPCAGMTALLSMCKLNIETGESILIDAGMGAVGQFAIQMAKSKELTVYTTASKEHHSYLKQLGADEVFDYHDPDVSDQINKALGAKPLDVVVDSIGGDTTLRNLELLKFNGKIACLNGLPDIDPNLLFSKAPSIHIVSLGGAWLADDMCAQQRLCLKGEHLIKLLLEKQISAPETKLISFDQVAVTQAMHKQLEGTGGLKQIVKISA